MAGHCENGQSNGLACGNVKRYRENLRGGGASCRKGQASASQKSQKLLLGDFPEIAKTYTRGLRNVQELFSDKDVSARNLSLAGCREKGPRGSLLTELMFAAGKPRRNRLCRPRVAYRLRYRMEATADQVCIRRLRCNGSYGHFRMRVWHFGVGRPIREQLAIVP